MTYYDENDEQPECLDASDEIRNCFGEVTRRPSLAGTGTMIARCEHHYLAAVERDQELRQRYPVHAPADFDPLYAGERWDDDY